MDWLHILLLILLFIAIGIIISYRRQIKNFCRQLAFLRKHDSNMIITQQIDGSIISELVREINALLQKQKKLKNTYQKKEETLKETFTSLSHDIRTPLTSLDGYFQLLQESQNEADRERYSLIIQERLTSLRDLLEELFLFTKIQNDEYELDIEDLPLQKILYEVIFSFYEDFKNKNITPEIDIDEAPVQIAGNPQALKRIFQNILKNILIHGQDRVCIRLKNDSPIIHLSFENLISEATTLDPDKIFDRFYKNDPSRGKNSTGLGLAIAKELTLKMGHEIHAEVEGNTFRIIVSFKI